MYARLHVSTCMYVQTIWNPGEEWKGAWVHSSRMHTYTDPGSFQSKSSRGIPSSTVRTSFQPKSSTGAFFLPVQIPERNQRELHSFSSWNSVEVSKGARFVTFQIKQRSLVRSSWHPVEKWKGAGFTQVKIHHKINTKNEKQPTRSSLNHWLVN